MMRKNKKAWIRIVEAFVAILMVTGVILIIINKGFVEKEDISATVYDVEIAILREIQLDDSLRNDILNVMILPMEWDHDNFPSRIKEKIIDRMPNYLDCEAKICDMNENCELNEYPKKDVYAQAVAITTTLQSPPGTLFKQLKLFCWV